MELGPYLEELLDQTEDDRLLSAADITRLVEEGWALTRGEAERLVLATDIVNIVDFDADNDESALVTITMQDLYPGDTTRGKTVYYFRPIVFIDVTGRVIEVDGAPVTSGLAYDPLLAKLTFTVQRPESAPVVTISGFMVNWKRTLWNAMEELEIKILTASDIHGSRNEQWMKRIEQYRLREFAGAIR